MKERIRIYYYFLIGGAGGLTGWLLGAWLLQAVSRSTAAGQQTIGQQFLYGAVLGAAIGISIAVHDGVVSRSLIRFAKFGGIGLLFGFLAGGLALPLTQALYVKLLGTQASAGQAVGKLIFVGLICWVLFGGLIGLGEGVSKGTQSWKGWLGGTIGGLIGGLIYEINRASADNVTVSYRQQFFLAISLMLLGAAISAAIAFVTAMLKQAWVEVLNGKYENRSFDVTKYVNPRTGRHHSGSIGSDQWSSNVYLPGDPLVLPRHAEINFANGAPTLTVTPEASKRDSTFVNGRKVSSCHLSDGDTLLIGSTQMIYHQKRR